MSGTHTGNISTDITREEHASVNGVNAKRVVPYVLSGNNSNPIPMGGGLIAEAFDTIQMSDADGNGNYQTWTIKSGGTGGTTVGTLSLTYDSNSKITSLVRT